MKLSYAQTAKQKEKAANEATAGTAGQNTTKPVNPTPSNPWQKQPQVGTSVKVNEVKETPVVTPAPSVPNTPGSGQKKIPNYNQHPQHQHQYYGYPQYPADYNQYQYYYPPQQQYNQPPAFELPTPSKVKIKIVDPLSKTEVKLPTPVKVTIKAPTKPAESSAPVVKIPESGKVVITPAKPVTIKPPTDGDVSGVKISSAATDVKPPVPTQSQIKSPVAAKANPTAVPAVSKFQTQAQAPAAATKPAPEKPVTLAEKVAQGKAPVETAPKQPEEPVKPSYAQPAKKPVEEVKPKTPMTVTKPSVAAETKASTADKPPAPPSVPVVQQGSRPASPSKPLSPAKNAGPPGLAQPTESAPEKYTVKKIASEPEGLEDGQITEFLPDAPLISTFGHITYPAFVTKKPYVENGEIKYPVEFLMLFHEKITAKPKEMMAWKDIYGDDANRQPPVRMSRQSSDRGRGRGQRGRGDRDRGSDRVEMSRQHSNSSRSGRGHLPPKGGRNRGHVAPIHVAPLVKGENAWDPKKLQLDESAAALKVIKGLLNKLTMDTFPKLSAKMIESNISNEDTLSGMIDMISEKAIDEPHFASLYAMLCQKLFTDLPAAHPWVCPSNEVQHNVFRKLLLKRCQNEFEKDAKWKAADDEAQIARAELRKRIDELSEEEKAQIAEEDYQRGKLKRRVLGNMVFIGELYRQTLISEAVIHRCLKSLLTEIENPEEEDIESLCKLLTSAGRNLDHPRAETVMNHYFDRINLILKGAKLSSRIKFLLMDVVDLRANKWIPKSGVISKPKTIAEVHKEIQMEEKSKLLAQRQGNKNSRKATRSQQQSQPQDIRKIAQKEDGEWTSTRQAWGSGGSKSRAATTPSASEQSSSAKLSNAYGALEAEQSPDKPAPEPAKTQMQIMEEVFKDYRESLEASELLEDIQDVDEDEVIISLVKNIAQFLVDKNGSPALKVISLLKKIFFADEESESTAHSFSPDLLVAGFKQFFETFDDDRSDFPKGFYNLSQVLNPLFAEKYISFEQLLEISAPIAGYAGRKPVLPDFLADFLKVSESPFQFIAENEFNIKPFFPDNDKFAANVESWSKMKSLDPSSLYTEVLTLVTKEYVFNGDFTNEANDDPKEMKRVFELLQPSLINYKQEVLDHWNLDPVSILIDTQKILLEYNFTHYADSIFHILYGGDFFDKDAFLKFKNEHGAPELEDSLRKWEKKLQS